MDDELLLKLIKGEKITQKDIEYGLYEMCDRVHAHCDYECLVFRLNGNRVPDTANDFNINRGCDCFKNGNAMFNFIKERI